MNPGLLSANLSLLLIALLAVSLLAHFSQLGGKARYSHLVQSATAAGLMYLLGEGALGWRFMPREALLALFAALFAAIAAISIIRRVRSGEVGSPSAALLIEMGAMVYIFSPARFWKPPVAALLFILFLFELVQALKGSQPIAEEDQAARRPPLFPPKRVRGVKEFASAAVALAFVYVFAMGTGKPPVETLPEQQTTSVEESAEPQANAETPAPAETQQSATASQDAEPAGAPKAKESAPAPQASAKSYRASAGETLKSIARKLYGKPDRWRRLAELNPGLKPTAKLKAGQAIKLPPPQNSEP